MGGTGCTEGVFHQSHQAHRTITSKLELKMGNPAVHFLLFYFFSLTSATVFRIPFERRQTRSDSSNRSGRLTFKNLRNEEYWGSIMIGTPSQNFEAMFDTGSHLIWVPNKRCSNCHGKNMFDEDKSSTYTDLNRTISLDYAIGYMEGICGKDVVKVAGIEIKNQEIATATKAAFQENLFDGIVGLSFTPDRYGSLKSLVDNLLEQKKLTRNIFSFHMNRNGNPHDGGELLIGGWNESLFDSESINYIPTESYNWQFTIDSIYFGKETMPCDGCVAIADTGNTMITGPYNALIPYIKKINGKELADGYYFVKCETVPSLPDLSFVIHENKYTLKGEDYTFKNSSYPGYCMLGIAPSYDYDWVLGIMFLSNYYSIFDMEKKSVAFAPLKTPI